MRFYVLVVFIFAGCLATTAQPLTTAGMPARLLIREAAAHSLRITLKPLNSSNDDPFSPALTERSYPATAIDITELSEPITRNIGGLRIQVSPAPLTIRITTIDGRPVQTLHFNDSSFSFALDAAPVLGLGEGGHKPEPGTPWRLAPIEFDRRGRLQEMQPRWQSDAYGSRNPVPMLIGTAGWALFVATPWGQLDLRAADHGVFLPWKPTARDTIVQNERNQNLALAKGLPPARSVIPGLYDLIVFDAHDPAAFMQDLSILTGPAVLPPKWALGYMQSHRTIKDEKYILGIVDSFRSKRSR